MMSESTRYFLRDRNRITGPFDIGQLDSLKRRGRLARFQLLSTDRRNWVKADAIPGLFQPDELIAEEFQVHPEPAPHPSTGPEPTEVPCWYFAEGEQHSGPVVASELRNRISLGTLNPTTPVWREGMDAWQPAGSIPEFALGTPVGGGGAGSSTTIPPIRSSNGTHRSRPVPMAAVVVPIILLGGASLLFFTLRMGGDHRHSAVVSSPLDHDRITDAVGWVVTGWTIATNTGVVLDEIEGYGSCFAVTPDGYLITNMHVVKRIAPRLRMTTEALVQHYLEILRDAMLSGAREDSSPEEIERIVGEALETVEAVAKNLKSITPKVWVFFGDRNAMYTAEIVYESERYDMAILKIDRNYGQYFSLIPETETVSRGQKVHVLGFPGSSMAVISEEEEIAEKLSTLNPKPKSVVGQLKSRDFAYSITSGVVGKMSVEENGRRWIQHDATITQGNSGGPLVDDQGRVIAINTRFGIDEGDLAAALYSLEINQLMPEITRNIPGLP